MDSFKGLKRFLEFESQNETERDEVKRQRKALQSIEDDFKEFVALLDRIQCTKEIRGKCRRENLDSKVIKTKAPWIPSFEWEDFRVSAAMDPTGPSRMDNPISSEEKWKQIDQPADHLKKRSSSDDYDNSPASSKKYSIFPGF